MKLSRLYTNKPAIFEPVDFTTGLNVVLAEIRLPENRKKDTHNLGKTTLGRLIDFCLLSTRKKQFFLFKHLDRFRDFTFFIELELLDGSLVTVRRSVEEPSKISFKKHLGRGQDYTDLPESNWDHQDVPFDRAKSLLDGLLDLRAVKPWHYRSGLGYLLRGQDDFGDIFHLKKFSGNHDEWKPYLAHLLGFDADLISEHYRKENVLEAKQHDAAVVKRELAETDDISKVEGLLLLKQTDAEKKQRFLDSFDFRTQDKEKTKQLVDGIDQEIARLNSERYSLTQNRKKIIASLEDDQIMFDPDEAERLFLEAGVLFQGQIKRDFEQLISFNRAITDERRAYLLEERIEIDAALKKINSELNELGKRRSATLSYLSGTDIFAKYRQLSNEMVTLKAEIKSLERQRDYLLRLQELKKEIRVLTDERDQLQTRIEQDVEQQNSDSKSLFSTIRLYFSEIVEEVIDRKALLSAAPNKDGHLVFEAEILDETGNTTSQGSGFTYKKLLCIAFDMALVRAHLNVRFPRFIFHDGVFESLDDRKKENLLAVIRRYADMGIQHVITLIDSDLPTRSMAELPVFDEEEVVVRLHDENEQGKLFKMKGW